MKSYSIGNQIQLLGGMLGTKDLSSWEQSFVASMQQYKHDTTQLTEKQVEKVDDLFSKHFA